MITKINDLNLRPFNTMGVDAVCDEWIEFTEAADIPEVVRLCAGRKHKCIGSGSNMLFTGDYHGVLLHPAILDVTSRPADERDFVIVRAGAGVEMDSLIESCAKAGLWGLENLSGIPGLVGSSAIQNVGAYGVGAGDIISSVECYDTEQNRFVTLGKDDLGFGYRHSMFKEKAHAGRYIVSYVEYRLSRNPMPKLGYGSLHSLLDGSSAPTPVEVRNAVIAVREQKLPPVDKAGSAGSFFKNPVVEKTLFEKISAMDGIGEVPHYEVEGGIKIPAAWLIDRCGLKGCVEGGAAVWQKQPLVIVNSTGHATADDILRLEALITETVKKRFGIELFPEVEHIN